MAYIISYDDAREICETYSNFNFSEHQFYIDGYKISTFDYFICDYKDFANPIPNKPHIHAFDMRGVTFIFNKDGSIWNRFLMLPKFFNLNQIEETQYNKVKDKKISHISVKEDGSLVTFMMLPNENIFCKTIRGFTNEQSISAFNVLNKNKDNTLWVKSILKEVYTPLFEYVSWDNRIVLKYSNPELRFIGLRDNNIGKFIPASIVDHVPSSLYCIETEEATLDELVERSKIEENKEGWVIIFDDGMLLKIKTNWYFNIHKIRTDNIFREDYIIHNYYNETLDDILAQLNPKEDVDAYTFVDRITTAVNRWSDHIDNCVKKMYNIWKHDYNGDWAKFAANNNKELYFVLVKYYDDKNEYKNRKVNIILNKTNKLKKARQIIDKWSKN